MRRVAIAAGLIGLIGAGLWATPRDEPTVKSSPLRSGAGVAPPVVVDAAGARGQALVAPAAGPGAVSAAATPGGALETSRAPAAGSVQPTLNVGPAKSPVAPGGQTAFDQTSGKAPAKDATFGERAPPPALVPGSLPPMPAKTINAVKPTEPVARFARQGANDPIPAPKNTDVPGVTPVPAVSTTMTPPTPVASATMVAPVASATTVAPVAVGAPSVAVAKSAATAPVKVRRSPAIEVVAAPVVARTLRSAGPVPRVAVPVRLRQSASRQAGSRGAALPLRTAAPATGSAVPAMRAVTSLAKSPDRRPAVLAWTSPAPRLAPAPRMAPAPYVVRQ
jgi:hypothetical protein